jgi:hypothetical protein
MKIIDIFQQADLGLNLGVEACETLTVEPARRRPPDFAETLKEHKWYLLVLLRLPSVIAYSKALKQTVFFADDEDTKAVPVEAGADPGSVYTRQELRALVEAKRLFNAELVNGSRSARP